MRARLTLQILPDVDLAARPEPSTRKGQKEIGVPRKTPSAQLTWVLSFQVLTTPLPVVCIQAAQAWPKSSFALCLFCQAQAELRAVPADGHCLQHEIWRVNEHATLRARCLTPDCNQRADAGDNRCPLFQQKVPSPVQDGAVQSETGSEGHSRCKGEGVVQTHEGFEWGQGAGHKGVLHEQEPGWGVQVGGGKHNDAVEQLLEV